MAISRRIFELWQKCQSVRGLDVFSTGAIHQLKAEPEFSRLKESLLRHTSDADAAILLSLRALAIQQHELADRLSETELAVTLPTEAVSAARPTCFVIRDMIESAKTEILLAGYRVTNRDILELLYDAAARGVRLTLVCGRADGDATAILNTWPRDIPRPRMYQDADSSLESLMHVKALLCDGEQLLISSANFTHRGMKVNIELGIRTTGIAATEARSVLMQLLDSDMFEQIA